MSRLEKKIGMFQREPNVMNLKGVLFELDGILQGRVIGIGLQSLHVL